MTKWLLKNSSCLDVFNVCILTIAECQCVGSYYTLVEGRHNRVFRVGVGEAQTVPDLVGGRLQQVRTLYMKIH